ncbi:hypothetical protein [Streptomyces sp. NPDC056399]|uniref:hypothetical protein n=1 Tax=Streptomyces sp. NPDC056399 TaxID=3345807 RepID=UPI0035E2F49E
MRFHPFPDDLVTAQRSWTATYEELAHPATTRTTLLRRRLLHYHPYWTRPRPAAGRPELRALLREQRAREGRAA